MSDSKRRRSDSRSPPAARNGKGAYDSLDEGRCGGGRRSSRHDNQDYYDHNRDRDLDRERGRNGGGARQHGDREYDGGVGGGRGRTLKEEPSSEALGPRFGSDRGRDRGQDRDRAREGDRRELDGSYGGGGGAKREAQGMERDVREAKRDRGANGDWSDPPSAAAAGGRRSGSGRDGGEASRYLSAEEREDRQRQEEEAAKPKAPKEAPNLGLSGKLAAETNKVAGGVELKHVPPPEARLPDKRWRLYIFKNDQLQDEPYRIHRMNHYLFGRDLQVADIITAHPSCSKQHAVLQFRLTEKNDELGRPVSAVRPYLLDLGSVNGTFLNGERLEPLRYYELLEKDVVRLGQSSREYVLLHDKSGDE